MQEDLTFALKLNAGQLNGEMAKTRASAANLGGGLGSVTRGLDSIGGKAGADARQGLGALSFAMGDSANEGSRLVNTIGDIAGVLSGGGLTIGLAAAGAAIAGLTSSWLASKKAAEEAGKASVDAVNKILSRAQSARDSAVQALGEAIGVSAMRQDVAGLTAELEDAQRNLDEALSPTILRDIAEAQSITISEAYRINETRKERLRAQISDLEITLAQLRPLVAETEAALEGTAALGRLRATDATGRAAPSRAAATGDPFARINEHERKANEALAKANEERAEQQYKSDFERFKASEAAEDEHQRMLYEITERWQKKENALRAESAKLDEEVRERQLREQEAFAQAMAQVSTQAIGIGVSATQGLVDDMITGQEHALEHFAANISRQAGSALIGHGINLAGAATVSALTGALPLAAAQGAGAAGLIGAGIALGGVATGIEHTLAGGSIGRPLPENPSGNRSSSRGPRGGDDGNGTFQIVVNYGVAGPAPEDTARAVAKANRTASRRGIG